MTMPNVEVDVEVIRLRSLLAEIRNARKQIVEENATTVNFGGRTISRPPLVVLAEEEGRARVPAKREVSKVAGSRL